MSTKEQYEALKQYLLSCFYRNDWHGVSDAANDLRVMEAQHPELLKRTSACSYIGIDYARLSSGSEGFESPTRRQNLMDHYKKQGDVGLGAAIAYFTSQLDTVLLPLSDSQDYDLVVDRDGVLYRVQVKTSCSKKNSNSYTVDLRIKGNNGIQKFGTDLNYDLLFVLVQNGDQYLIPKSVIGTNKNSVTVGPKYDQYKITTDSLAESA